MLMCPACGWLYNPDQYSAALLPGELVPHHPLGAGWCPGTEQHPRNPEADMRPLWNGEPSPARRGRDGEG